METSSSLPVVKFKHLRREDESAFIEMIQDPTIQEYFEELSRDHHIISTMKYIRT